jgi:hypothetical protein
VAIQEYSAKSDHEKRRRNLNADSINLKEGAFDPGCKNVPIGLSSSAKRKLRFMLN